MFGRGAKFEDMLAQLRPELSREALGVGPSFPGVAPNPLLSRAARQRTAALRSGTLALGTLVDWREVSSDGSPRVVLMLDVETAEGMRFRGIADENLTITALTRLQPGDLLPVRYLPAVQDHCVILAPDADPGEVERLTQVIQQWQQP